MNNKQLTINKATLIPVGLAVVILVAAVSFATAYATTKAQVKDNTADLQSVTDKVELNTELLIRIKTLIKERS